MDDLISRRSAIDALCKACMLTSDYKKCEGYKPDSRWCEEITALREVPSAQPDGVDLFPAVSEEYKKGYRDGLRDKPEPCDDTISRQAVIELIQGSICDLEYSDENKELCDKVRALPPSHAIEPEQIVRCKDCEYGDQDEYGRWYCRGFGCQVGDEDGSGFCSDAERKNNV